MVKYVRALVVFLLCCLVLPLAAYANSGSAHGLHPRLRSVLAQVQNHFHRPLVIVSGCRSRTHNRQIGGAEHSWHLHCQAADIEIKGVNKYVLARFAAGLQKRGGIGTYCNDRSVHIDIGPRRQWYWCGRVRTFDQGAIHRTSYKKKRHRALRHKRHHKRH